MFNKLNSKKNFLMILSLGILFVLSVDPQPVWAQKQDGKVIGEVTPAPSTPAPAPSLPRIRRRAPVQWLSMRRQLSVIDQRLGDVPVDPVSSQFFDNDPVKVKFQFSQDGYIYIVNYTIKDDGKFTTPHLVGLSNLRIPKLKTMEWKGRLSPPSGKEVFVIIYSREPRTELVNLVNRSQNKSVAVVPDNILFDLIQKSHQTVTKQEKLVKAVNSTEFMTGNFITLVQNNSAKNLDLLIDRLEFIHK